MKKLGVTMFSIVAAAAMLTACGGGGDNALPVTNVATTNVTAPITAASVSAVTGQAFTFNGGVGAFQTASPTTVTLNSASSFSVASNEGTASGNLGFGSCIFTVTQSTFPASSPLAVGKTLEVQPCAITVATAGVSAEQNATARAVSFQIEGNASIAKDLTVDITSTGTVVVNGTNIGSVTLQPTTGGVSQ
jgi:hypothetical protein